MKITFSNIRFMNNKVPDYRENKSTGFMLAALYILLKNHINFLLLQANTNRYTFHLKIYSNCLPLYLNDVINISCDIQKKLLPILCFSSRNPGVSSFLFFILLLFIFVFIFNSAIFIQSIHYI